jgi:hypothetical protein
MQGRTPAHWLVPLPSPGSPALLSSTSLMLTSCAAGLLLTISQVQGKLKFVSNRTQVHSNAFKIQVQPKGTLQSPTEQQADSTAQDETRGR